MEQGEKVIFTLLDSKWKNNAKNNGKDKTRPKAGNKKESKCFFYKNKGHMKKDCTKHKAWLEKKGTYLSFVYYESNFTNVNHNTW